MFVCRVPEGAFHVNETLSSQKRHKAAKSSLKLSVASFFSKCKLFFSAPALECLLLQSFLQASEGQKPRLKMKTYCSVPSSSSSFKFALIKSFLSFFDGKLFLFLGVFAGKFINSVKFQCSASWVVPKRNCESKPANLQWNFQLLSFVSLSASMLPLLIPLFFFAIV